MKKIYIFIAAFFMFGAVQQAAAQKCDNKAVKEQVIKLYKDYNVKVCNELLQYGDAMILMGYDPQVINKGCKLIKNGKITIENVITTNINKSVQKYFCQGTFKMALNGLGHEERISYSFQPTDDRKNLWIQIEDVQ